MELKNIKYQTMLLNNNSKIFESIPNITNIEKFLTKDKEVNKNKPWSKLNKGTKIKLLTNFANDYQEKNEINDKEKKQLIQYLKQCLERKKLNKKQDLVYDTENFKIISIINLIYNKTKNRFTLKKQDKRISSLKSLAPKNKTKRVKHSKERAKKSSKDKKKVKNIKETKASKTKASKTKASKTKESKTKASKTKESKTKASKTKESKTKASKTKESKTKASKTKITKKNED